MPRYIDADALMDWIIEAEEADPDWCVNPVKNIFDHIEELPPADVVEKERYDRLLENATIMAEALNEYQTADVHERNVGDMISRQAAIDAIENTKEVAR